jgi:hypothetical protein
MEYQVSGFNSCNYPLLPLHKVLLSSGLSPTTTEEAQEDPDLVQIYASRCIPLVCKESLTYH